MCITEYNEKSFVNGIRAEERTELVEGMIRENLPLEQIARIAKITVEEVEQIKQSLLATI